MSAIVVTLAGAVGVAHAGCPSTPADAAATAEAASDAFASMRGSEFDEAFTNLRSEISCLSSSPDAHQVAMIHRAYALAAFKTKDVQGTLDSFQAMHTCEPGIALSQDLAPSGGPLARRSQEALAMPPSPRAPHGAGLNVYVDGVLAPDLPTSRPSVVVVLDGSGAVLWSGMVPAGDSIPSLWGASVTILNVEPNLPPTESIATSPPLPMESPAQGVDASPSRAGRPFLIAAGGTAVLSGAMGAWTFSLRARQAMAAELIASSATDEEWTEALGSHLSKEELLSMNDRGQVIGIGSLVAGGLAVGLGTVGLVLKW